MVWGEAEKRDAPLGVEENKAEVEVALFFLQVREVETEVEAERVEVEEDLTFSF